MKSAAEDAGASLRTSSLLDWEHILHERLPHYGHRNWLVVADSAYPAQSRDGIETIVARAEQTVVVKKVLGMIRASGHVKPIVYTDQELKFVPEQDAPGISAYRERLASLLDGFEVSVLPHEEIIAKLDRAGQTFRVLVVKTNMKIPYSSVFFELDCAYWNADAEGRLRLARKHEPRKTSGVGSRRR
jgi:hypothetical protein